MTKKYGLIGYPLSHSFSPGYFAEKFEKEQIKNTRYDLYPLENLSNFCHLIKTERISGLNVTIPYKESIIPYLDELSDACKKIQAVNTIKNINGKLIGHNTDVIGFESSLLELLDGKTVKNALILGTGGAAKAVAYVLSKLDITYLTISRKPPYITYNELSNDIIATHTLIVNTTPLGMHPKIDTCPDLPYSAISEQHFMYDLVYNPEKTIFLRKGIDQGATVKNGYDMLIRQAEASWNIWNYE